MIIAAMPDFHLGIEDIFGTGDRKGVRPHARPPMESGHRAGEGLPSSRRHYLNVPCPHTPGVPDGCASRLFTASVAFTVISAARPPAPALTGRTPNDAASFA